MATEHDLPAKLLGRLDHRVKVLDCDVHTPVLGELHARGGDHLEVVRDAGIFEVAEVVVVELGRGGPVLLEEVQL